MNGWTVIVKCPHGVAMSLPLRALYSLDMEYFQSGGEFCEHCKFEWSRPPKPAMKPWLAWMASWVFKRELKDRDEA